MLTERRTHTTIPASDVERAMRWYEEKLGFKPKRRLEGAALYETAGGGRFILYPTPNAGKAPQTVIGFATPDIEVEVRALKARGVVFEEYDYPTLKTVGSIATTGSIRAAWFRDSEGNILGLAQVPEW
jgi:catechol 2,3-dioxygenase-like lactoylglutathione lyase family enzyme